MGLKAAVARLLIQTTDSLHATHTHPHRRRPPTAHGPSALPPPAPPSRRAKKLGCAACTKGSRTLRDPALVPGGRNSGRGGLRILRRSPGARQGGLAGHVAAVRNWSRGEIA